MSIPADSFSPNAGAPESESDVSGQMRRIRENLARILGGELDALHRLDPNLHVRYALFPAMMFAGFSLIALAMAHSPFSWALYLPGVLLAALGMNSCFLLIHEAVHGILFRIAAWNRVAGILLSACGGMAFSAYRCLHLRHHEYLGDPRDPDDYANYTSKPRLVWWMHFNRIAFGTLLYLVLIPVLSLRHATPSERRNIAFEYLFIAVLAGTLIVSVPISWFLLGWGIPFLLTNWMINIRGFSQHGITIADDPYLASRSTVPHPWVRFFLINENFHLEHHLFPGVPGYHLDRLHKMLGPLLPRRVLCSSYSSFLLRFLRQARTMDNRPIGLIPSENLDGIENAPSRKGTSAPSPSIKAFS
jgi:fatty acid desaturase